MELLAKVGEAVWIEVEIPGPRSAGRLPAMTRRIGRETSCSSRHRRSGQSPQALLGSINFQQVAGKLGPGGCEGADLRNGITRRDAFQAQQDDAMAAQALP